MSYLPRSHTITFEAALRDLDSKDVRARAAAAHALGDVEQPEEMRRAAEALVARLEDPHPHIRSTAAMSLGELASAEAVPELIARLEDPEAVVRQTSAIALGKIGTDAAFERLRHALADAPPDVRFQAVTSLVEIDPERAFEPLCEALSDEDPEVVGAAAAGLGAIGDRHAIPRLADVLEHPSAVPRFEAAYALAHLGDTRGVGVLAADLEDPARGWAAIEGIEKAGDPAGVRALAPLLGRRFLARILKLRAACAVLALAPDGQPATRARDVLVAGLRARKFEQRALAVELLGRVGGAWARAPLEMLRRRRGGRGLAAEIDEALSSLAERS